MFDFDLMTTALVVDAISMGSMPSEVKRPALLTLICRHLPIERLLPPCFSGGEGADGG
jgi:hypothetical protein